MNKMYKIIYKMEYTFTEKEVKELDGIDNVIQECIDQDSSEHSDKSNWIVEEDDVRDVQKKILNKYNN